MPVTLTVKNLQPAYQKASSIDYQFTLQDSEVTALVGVNGAGKSSLLKLLSGEESPTQGSVLLNQFDLLKDSEAYKSRCGYMPDIFPSEKNISVLSFLTFVAACYGMKKQEAQNAIQQVSAHLQLSRFHNKQLSHLSLGQKQRVSLAQALINQPLCLLMDEPLNGLDPTQQEVFWQIIKANANGRSVLLASHHLTDVLEYCDRLLIIDQHRLVADIPVKKSAYLAINADGFSNDEATSNVNSCRIHPKILGFADEASANTVSNTNNTIRVDAIRPALLQLFRQQATGEWQW